MPVTIAHGENTITARLSGELDHHTVRNFRTDIDFAIDLHRPENIVLDFGGVTFMDSSGIGLVMGRHKAASAYGGRITVLNPDEQVKKVMKLAGLERIAEIK